MTTKKTEETIEERLGKCFELSGKFILENPEWTLVHAVISDTVNKTGAQVIHAWCEKENAAIDVVINKKDSLVYDSVLNEHFPRRLYYALCGIIRYTYNDHERRLNVPESLLVRYTYEEAFELIQETRTYGPWDQKILNYKEKPNK